MLSSPPPPQPGSRSVIRGVGGPAALTAVLAAIWALVDPPSIDLAAQQYRADLFEAEGFVRSSPDWYGGFEVPGYSLLYPPLGAWLGVLGTGVLAAVVASAAFALLCRRQSGRAGEVAAWWFAVAITTQLLTGRITFTLGVAFGLAAALAVQDRRPVAAAVLGAATAAASPVAAVFLALAGAAAALGSVALRPAGLAAAGGAGAIAAFMGIAWPIGGVFPFDTTAFVAIPLFCAVALWVLPRDQAVLRWSVALYALLGFAAFAIDNPFGANSTRLGALFGGPALALALWPREGSGSAAAKRGRRALALLAVPLLYWQWVSTIDSLIASTPDPLRDPARTAPLLNEIDRIDDDLPAGFRVHVPPTRTRWEAVHVAERHPIARGWLRQLESDDFDLFTDGRLTPDAYRSWLADHQVALVAVPDATADYLAGDERELIADGLSYLDPVWANADWALFRVRLVTTG